MGKKIKKGECIRYQGTQWIKASLPHECQNWLQGKQHSTAKDLYHRRSAEKEISALVSRNQWIWPKRPHNFFSDMHADADAFIASLVASGGIRKTGPGDRNFKLSKEGRKAVFVIGGDCFDKGPSNIRLLRIMRRLMDKKAKIKILAGNHDVRMLLGIRAVGLPPNPRTDHFFIRMGPKVIPFLKEVYQNYLQG
ncbi:MAG: metallophosphoesterase, partial [Pseudomonadota bacterium]|nr:metallophosphoesterase [Pseudomonadota bacterium]